MSMKYIMDAKDTMAAVAAEIYVSNTDERIFFHSTHLYTATLLLHWVMHEIQAFLRSSTYYDELNLTSRPNLIS